MSPTRTRRTPLLRAAVAATALTLTLAACGGDDEAESPTEESQEQTEGADEPDTTEPEGDHAEHGDEDVEGHEDAAPDSQEAPGDKGWDGTTEPAFLEAGEMPNPNDEPWSVTDTSQGPPQEERFCTDGVLPAEGVWSRNFTKDTMGAGFHVVVHTADEAAATELMDQLTAAIAACETRNSDQGTVEFEDHGDRAAGDAARSYATVFTPDAPSGISGDGIGVARSGSTVTYVLASGMADLQDLPAGSFDEPLTTALSRIG